MHNKRVCHGGRGSPSGDLRALSPRTRGRRKWLSSSPLQPGVAPPTIWLFGGFSFSPVFKQMIPLGGWEGDIFLHQFFQYPRRISSDVNARKKCYYNDNFHNINSDHSSQCSCQPPRGCAVQCLRGNTTRTLGPPCAGTVPLFTRLCNGHSNSTTSQIMHIRFLAQCLTPSNCSLAISNIGYY